MYCLFRILSLDTSFSWQGVENLVGSTESCQCVVPNQNFIKAEVTPKKRKRPY